MAKKTKEVIAVDKNQQIKSALVERSKITAAIHACGFNDDLLTCLSLSSDPRYKQLATRAERGEAPFLELCQESRVTIHELEELWLTYSKTKGKIVMATELPTIMKDIARDAKSTVEDCDVCKGLGRIVDDKEEYPACPSCKGHGKRYLQGDKESQRLVLETMGMLSKAPMVNIGQMGDNYRLENLVRDSDDIMKNVTIEMNP